MQHGYSSEQLQGDRPPGNSSILGECVRRKEVQAREVDQLCNQDESPPVHWVVDFSVGRKLWTYVNAERERYPTW